MKLTPRETDRLLLFLAAELARRRQTRGLKLNYPEALALLADEICERARDGHSLAEVTNIGSSILTSDDVQPGVAELIGTLQVEPLFEDGQKLVTIYDPIGLGHEPQDTFKPGEYLLADDDIVLNQGRKQVHISVTNMGDRPIQVGSHFHFFEVNRALSFDRTEAFGMRLDIPAGTAVRFEPGESHDVDLVALGGARQVYGLNGLTEGEINADTFDRATERLISNGFQEGS